MTATPKPRPHQDPDPGDTRTITHADPEGPPAEHLTDPAELTDPDELPSGDRVEVDAAWYEWAHILTSRPRDIPADTWTLTPARDDTDTAGGGQGVDGGDPFAVDLLIYGVDPDTGQSMRTRVGLTPTVIRRLTDDLDALLTRQRLALEPTSAAVGEPTTTAGQDPDDAGPADRGGGVADRAKRMIDPLGFGALRADTSPRSTRTAMIVLGAVLALIMIALIIRQFR